MEPLLSDLKTLSYILIPLVGLAAWSIRLEMVVKANAEAAKEHRARIEKLFLLVDRVDASLQVNTAMTKMHDFLMSPDKQREFWVSQANTKKDLEYLVKEMDKCRSGSS